MKIRIEGLLNELEATITELHRSFVINSVSRSYKNRNSNYHRVYLDVEMRKE